MPASLHGRFTGKTGGKLANVRYLPVLTTRFQGKGVGDNYEFKLLLDVVAKPLLLMFGEYG
jgi:hypothetical protein